MRYWQFLSVFIIPWNLVGIYFAFKSKRSFRDLWFKGTFVLMCLALFYTAPWDNYLVKTQIWDYPSDRVLGRVGYVPIEEYAFFILQTLLASLWVYFVSSKVGISNKALEHLQLKTGVLAGILAMWIWSLLKLGEAHYEYLCLILIWSLPVIFLQWFVGAKYFLNNAKLFVFSIVPVTLYLWACDTFAIHSGIWRISSLQTTGIKVGSLPIEEAIFFLVTNVMVSLGLIFFLAMESRVFDLQKKIQRILAL